MRLAIFLLPEGDLRDELARWKERVKNEFPDQQSYTSHPPHMTLINVDVRDEEEGVAAVSTFSGSVNPFQITVNRTDVFWNDIATDGHTLYFGIGKNDVLQSLQKSLAEALQEVKKSVPPPDYVSGNKKFLKSFDKYGFPFVGDHWIPHFSVSSLRSEKTHPIIKDFVLSIEPYHFTANQISLWRVNGGEHTHLQTVYFQ